MAASMHAVKFCTNRVFQASIKNSPSFLSKTTCISNANTRFIFSNSNRLLNNGKFSKLKVGLGAGTVVGLTLGFAWTSHKTPVYADSDQIPDHKVSKSIKSATDSSGLKLKLYQYQTCPFCCKVRAYLDYYGFAYDVIEVNSVTRAQTKWSTYKKVPILVCENKSEDGFVQLNDSSVIISILDSFLEDKTVPLIDLISYYPSIEATDERGKKKKEFPNRYYVMFGDKKCLKTIEEMKHERKWRSWVDSNLVHMLSPNVYRTPREALQAFKYFSEVGEWEKHFSTGERLVVVYLGAFVMYGLGKMLAHRYKLKSDVRESLYDSLQEWTKGKKSKFMGGDSPDLADISAYGVLSSIEGCDAFQDALQNTNIKKWYYDTKAAVESHAGAHLISRMPKK